MDVESAERLPCRIRRGSEGPLNPAVSEDNLVKSEALGGGRERRPAA